MKPKLQLIPVNVRRARTDSSSKQTSTCAMDHAVHCDERMIGDNGADCSKRQEIRSNSVSTPTPAFRSSIICSTVNPACSPINASFWIPDCSVDFSIGLPQGLLIGRGSHRSH